MTQRSRPGRFAVAAAHGGPATVACGRGATFTVTLPTEPEPEPGPEPGCGPGPESGPAPR